MPKINYLLFHLLSLLFLLFQVVIYLKIINDFRAISIRLPLNVLLFFFLKIFLHLVLVNFRDNWAKEVKHPCSSTHVNFIFWVLLETQTVLLLAVKIIFLFLFKVDKILSMSFKEMISLLAINSLDNIRVKLVPFFN